MKTFSTYSKIPANLSKQHGVKKIFITRCIIFGNIFIVDSFEKDFSYRLPNSSYPLKYDLKFKLSIENESRDFDGHVKLCIKIREQTDEITIHAK